MTESLFPELELQNRQILQGDVLENLNKLPTERYNTIVTSPPYYGIRDYGVDGQWGLEKDPSMYLDSLSKMMGQIRRVLTNDGIAWINLGDSIIEGGWYGFPEMFFSNCRKQGWISVSKPIWWKRNAMPSSTKIRFAPRYENIYGFAKKNKYFFNLDAIRIPAKVQPKPFNLRVREAKKGKLEKKYGTQYTATEQEIESHDNLGVKKQDVTLGADGKPKGNYVGFNERWKRKMLDVPGQTTHGIHRKRHSGYYGANGEYLCNPLGKNPGDIFDITVKPFKGSHFATFPPDLPEILIKSSCPENGWVLDPFFGSGTVGLVAEKLNRNWTGIEIKKSYIDIAKERISKSTGVKFE